MTNSDPEQQEDALSLDYVRELIELLIQHDLSELDLRQRGHRVRIRRGVHQQAADNLAPSSSGPPLAAPLAETAPPEAPADDDTQTAEHIVVIKSPMVGTYYNRSNPDAEPYVKVGDHVGPDTIVCIIEAMKVFNEIPAEFSGRVVAILVDNEEPVEYGKPLLKIDTSG